MTFRLSTNSKRRLSGVNPALIEIVERALNITRIDFGIPSSGGFRTAEQQKALFDAGVSKCDGYKNRSCHQTGNAVDVFAYVDGAASWDEDDLTHVAAAMLQAASELGYKLEWGGFWRSFVDMPHFQLMDE